MVQIVCLLLRLRVNVQINETKALPEGILDDDGRKSNLPQGLR